MSEHKITLSEQHLATIIASAVKIGVSEALAGHVGPDGAAPSGNQQQKFYADGKQAIDAWHRPASTFARYTARFEWQALGQLAFQEDGKTPQVSQTGDLVFYDKHDGRGIGATTVENVAEPAAFKESALILGLKNNGSLGEYTSAKADPLRADHVAALLVQVRPTARQMAYECGALPMLRSLVSQGSPFNIWITPAMARARCLSMGPLVDAEGRECNDAGEPREAAAVAAE